ncbi:rhomboid family intramembrane serine protease [Simkania negevensis]|uniref:Rhomboid family intramembrane serine protease n=1 Tax=Simkania negevensis TaxID=83561 RepID=A0ABS3ARP6_9BACT|nr:rhomboid family intramembrane serine protease [Simkania negevensis]
MRLITTLENGDDANRFSYFLTVQGIENEVECSTVSKDGADITNYLIWIDSEEQLDNALDWLDKFLADPHKLQFEGHEKEAKQILHERSEKKRKTDEEWIKEKVKEKKPLFVRRKSPTGTITAFLLGLCIVIFLWQTFSSLKMQDRSEISIPPILLAPPITKALLYDYPSVLDLLDKLIVQYGPDILVGPDSLPQEAKELIHQINHSAYWQGIYDEFLLRRSNPKLPQVYNDPMFEQIRQGEWWRIFTPCLLHANLFHIFFNMVWLVFLGNQMEQRMKKWRYLLFVLFVGALSNTMQYLMGGFNFMGFSGVITGMAGFIYVRQHVAPWEGYQLAKLAIIIISLFIFGMFAVQLLSFSLELAGKDPIPTGIANTAHIGGAIIGMILGRWDFCVKKVGS